MAMKKFLLILSFAALLCSCEKKAEYNRTLGLMSEYNKLSAEGGKTDVAVFSNTDWTVEFDRPAPWASIDRLQGFKSGRVIFSFEKNFGRARRVILIFKAGDQQMTQNMYQVGGIADADVVLKVVTTSIEAPAEGLQLDIPFETNLIYNLDEIYLTVTYPEGQEPAKDWIRLVDVQLDVIKLVIDANQSGEPRIANARVTHTDAGSLDSKDGEGDSLYSQVISVTQL